MGEPITPGSEEGTQLTGTVSYRPVLPLCKPGRYAVKKLHASGGMGEVWLADDLDIGRPVALKRLRGERSEQTERFLIEAQVTGQLEHPGVVPVHDLGADENGQPFYIMSFVGGPRLKDVIADYHSPNAAGKEPREVQRLHLLEAFVQLCRTIAYAHSKGVIHRDIKPDNVMLGPYGETIVLDWGLAKVLGHPDEAGSGGYVQLTYTGNSTATLYGQVIGAPPYMAPEAADGKAAEADERTDVYLLGATLYEVLTGRPPRQGSSKKEMIEMARTVPPVPPRQVNPQVPRALEAICLRAMAHRKQDRYPGALELADEMQRYLAGEPVAAYPESFAARAWRWCRRHRRALSRSAAVAVVLGLALLALAVVQDSRRRQRDAERRSAELLMLETARDEVKQFRQLAGDLYYHAATEGPSERAAPYSDPALAVKAGESAWAIARGWGPDLADMPLEKERLALQAELPMLLLMLVQVRSQQQLTAASAQEMLGLLTQAEALGESSRSLHRLRAECHRRLGNLKQAKQEKQLAEKLGVSASALDHFLHAEDLRWKGASTAGGSADQAEWRPDRKLLADAVAEYRNALALQPGHYWSLFQLGRCLNSLDRPAEAVVTLGACVELRPEAPWAYTTRALALTRRRRFPEAERDLDKALELRPGFQQALLNRGVLRWRQDQPDRALEDFKLVTLTEGAYYRGLLLLESGKPAAALEEFDRVVREQPRFRPVYLLRARACFSRNEDQGGLDELDSYLRRPGQQRDAASADAYQQRGTLLRRLLAGQQVPKDKDKLAVGQLLQAVKLGGKSPELYRELGALVDNPRQADLAIKYYSQGLAIDPGHLRLLINRGWAAARFKKNYQQAQEDFTRAAKVPDNHRDAAGIRAEAHAGLGFVHARSKAVADARTEAALALLYGANNYIIVHNVACIFAELALVEPAQARAHEDVALEHLRRGVLLWEKDRRGISAQMLMKLEAARGSFHSLKARPEFQELLRGPKM
jgi:tetratricopeptide (TPR) repeat protein